MSDLFKVDCAPKTKASSPNKASSGPGLAQCEKGLSLKSFQGVTLTQRCVGGETDADLLKHHDAAVIFRRPSENGHDVEAHMNTVPSNIINITAAVVYA